MTDGKQVRRWTFTVNNPTETPEEIARALSDGKGFRFLIFQKEQGENGTPHWQGYVEFKSSRRFAAVRRMLERAHWEPAQGNTASNIHYCSKPLPDCLCNHCASKPLRLEGPYRHGEPGQETQGIRTDLEALRDAVKAGKRKRELLEDGQFCGVLAKYPKFVETCYELFPPERNDPVAVTLLYGPTGCGKTHQVRSNSDDLWIQSLGSQGWYNGYDGQSDALFDDFGGSSSHTRLDDMLRLLHEWLERVPIKGGFTWWRPKRIFITTNIHPFRWYEYKDREEQYLALRRRITMVVTWRSNGSDRREHNKGSQGFDGFWSTFEVGSANAPLERIDGPMDGFVLRSRPAGPERVYDWLYDVLDNLTV